MGGFIDVIYVLVINGADIDKTNINNWTALLSYAYSQYEYAEIIDFLISQRANVNSETKDEVSSIMMASFHGHEAIIKFRYIIRQMWILYKDFYEKTPIFLACLFGNVDIARF